MEEMPEPRAQILQQDLLHFSLYTGEELGRLACFC